MALTSLPIAAKAIRTLPIEPPMGAGLGFRLAVEPFATRTAAKMNQRCTTACVQPHTFRYGEQYVATVRVPTDDAQKFHNLGIVCGLVGGGFPSYVIFKGPNIFGPQMAPDAVWQLSLDSFEATLSNSAYRRPARQPQGGGGSRWSSAITPPSRDSSGLLKP